MASMHSFISIPMILAILIQTSTSFEYYDVQHDVEHDEHDVQHHEHRVKRIVGGFPASSPPPPSAVNLDYEDDNALPSQPSSTTSTTPEPDWGAANDRDATVFVWRGGRRAEVTGNRDADGFYTFKGIRYAQAPVGSYRFQRPVRLYMTGKILANRFPPPCPQPYPNNKGYIGEEDCLFLNVFTPKLPLRGQRKSQGLPVIFWVHGGGFRRGSGSQYDPRYLVRQGVVVVTIQYRLGALGYLSTNTKDQPGNMGLFDINAAMKWTRDYIRFFGGNPHRIIASGQGSGASAAGMCANNRYNADSVKGVFAMSGSSVSSFAVDEKSGKTSQEVGQLNACQSEQGVALVRCMQKLPVEKIVEADNQFQDQKIAGDGPVKAMGQPLNPSPTVEGKNDGRFLPSFVAVPPIETLKSGKFLKVPLLTGVTKEETSTAVKGSLFNQVLGKAAQVTNQLVGSVFKDLVNVNTGLYSNGSVNPSLDKLFSSTNYISAVQKSLTATASTVDKLIEATTDALFNLPAFLTSELWTKHSKAYMYLFDHQSKKSTGKHFLDGLPLVQTSDDAPSKGLGHGDDLIYLFEPCTLQGEPIQSAKLTSESDKKVREHFTTMVAEFARSGEPKIPTAGVRSWRSFDADTSEYLQLSERPSVKTGFRKCQMALWAGLGETLKSAECNILGAGELVTQLTGLQSSGLLDPIQGTDELTSAFTDPLKTLTKNPLTGNLNKVGEGLLTGGLLGGLGGGGGNQPPQNGGLGGGLLGGLGGNQPSQNGGGRRTTTQKPSGGGFGIFG